MTAAARAATVTEVVIKRAINAARKASGGEVTVAIEPSGRILILPGAGAPRPVDSFD